MYKVNTYLLYGLYIIIHNSHVLTCESMFPFIHIYSIDLCGLHVIIQNSHVLKQNCLIYTYAHAPGGEATGQQTSFEKPPYIHIYIFIYIHTYAYVYKFSDITRDKHRSRIYTCIYTYICIYTHTFIYMYPRTIYARTRWRGKWATHIARKAALSRQSSRPRYVFKYFILQICSLYIHAHAPGKEVRGQHTLLEKPALSRPLRTILTSYIYTHIFYIYKYIYYVHMHTHQVERQEGSRRLSSGRPLPTIFTSCLV